MLVEYKHKKKEKTNLGLECAHVVAAVATAVWDGRWTRCWLQFVGVVYLNVSRVYTYKKRKKKNKPEARDAQSRALVVPAAATAA